MVYDLMTRQIYIIYVIVAKKTMNLQKVNANEMSEIDRGMFIY